MSLLRMSVALDLFDFVNAALVAAAEVGGGQKGLYHFYGSFGGDDAAAEGEDVSVVVFAGEAGGDCIVGEGGADAGDFVGGDGNADAGATDRDTQIGLLRSDAFAYGLSVIGIVHGFFRGSALVVDGVSGGLEIFSNDFFERESRVIGANDDARLGWRFAHEQQPAGLQRRRKGIAIWHSRAVQRRHLIEYRRLLFGGHRDGSHAGGSAMVHLKVAHYAGLFGRDQQFVHHRLAVAREILYQA